MPDGTPQITITTDAKPWYQSKTIVINAAVLALGVAEQQLGLLEPVLPVPLWQVIAFALPVINTALRVITSQGVKL
jgi:hypothetical protein